MKKYALSLTSAFNTPSLLKSRIVMLYQKPSAHFAKAKFGFALPIFVLCMIVNACMQRSASSLSSDKMATVTITNNTTGITETKKIKIPPKKVSLYKKVSDEIGLTKMIHEKSPYTIKKLMDFYDKIPTLVQGKITKNEDVERMQEEVFTFLLRKGIYKSEKEKELAFVAKGVLKHAYVNIYFVLPEKGKEWVEEFLPNLKEQWTEMQFKVFATKLLASYGHLDKTTKFVKNGVNLSFEPLIKALNKQM